MQAVQIIEDCGCCQQQSGSGSGSGGDDGGPTVEVCCCPNPVPEFLFATITGCEGGSYPLDGQQTGSGGGVWNSGGGEICTGIGEFETVITFRCDGVLQPEPCQFVILFNDVAQGPFNGTLVSCDPFIWISDPINLDAFGCACGDFTVTVTE